MSEKARPGRLSLLAELRDHGPILFVYLICLAVLNYEVSNVHPDRYTEAGIALWKFALTAIVPLAWTLLYYYFRARDSQRLQHRWRTYGLLAGAFTALPLLIWVFARKSYLPDAQIVMLYEYAQFIWLALMVAHAWHHGGTARLAMFFGVCFLYGLLLENSGIIIGYFGESQYQIYLGWGDFKLPAPFATQAGWCIMFYVAIQVAQYLGGKIRWIGRGPLRLALLTTLIGVTLDLQIDPLASLSGLWWKWDPQLPAWFLGVPFLNYAAWFSAFLPFSYAYFRLRRDERLSDWQRNRRMLVIVPWLLLGCMALGGLIMAIYEGGLDGPTFSIVAELLHRVMPY